MPWSGWHFKVPVAAVQGMMIGWQEEGQGDQWRNHIPGDSTLISCGSSRYIGKNAGAGIKFVVIICRTCWRLTYAGQQAKEFLALVSMLYCSNGDSWKV